VRPARGPASASTTLPLLVAALMSLVLAGCIPPPAQGGTVVFAPGASERLSMAWRFGYAGLKGPEAPATARVLVALDGVPPGGGQRARRGDVLLESGDVAFVIAAADGTDRGGTVVDGWWSDHRVDELSALRVVIGDQRVRATSLRVGLDAPTGAAWVDVLGTVTLPDGQPLEVATRYDVAPGVEGMLVHTSFVLPTTPLEGWLAVGDALEGAPGATVRSVEASAGAPAALVLHGRKVGYAVVAVDAPWATVDDARAEHGLPLASLPTPPGEAVLYSRFFALLARPDATAVAVVQAREIGRAVGEIEVSAVDGRGLPALAPAGTRLQLVDERAPGTPLEVVLPRALAPGESLQVEVPAGAWSIRPSGTSPSEATGVAVEAGRLARARVRFADMRSSLRSP
jgi:hypothetical protein